MGDGVFSDSSGESDIDSPNQSDIVAISRQVESMERELGQASSLNSASPANRRAEQQVATSANRQSQQQEIDVMELEAAKPLIPQSPNQASLEQIPPIRVEPPVTRRGEVVSAELAEDASDTYVGLDLLQSWTLTPTDNIELAEKVSSRTSAIAARTKAKVQFTRVFKVQLEYIDYVEKEITPMRLKRLKGLQERVDDAAHRLLATQNKVRDFCSVQELESLKIHNIDSYRVQYRDVKCRFKAVVAQDYVETLHRLDQELKSSSPVDDEATPQSLLRPILRRLVQQAPEMSDEDALSEEEHRRRRDKGLNVSYRELVGQSSREGTDSDPLLPLLYHDQNHMMTSHDQMCHQEECCSIGTAPEDINK